jgi:hypothetical protein
MGVAKRKNRTLIEMARTMFDEYKISDQFWAEVINTACHVTNRLSLHKLLKKTSYELLTGNKPNVSYFQVFGSKCYILQKRSKSSKFDPKTYESVVLGYDSNSHAYRIFNITTGCVKTTCDVVFDETNSSQNEQVDLDLVDDVEASCDALWRMTIGNVRPQDPNNQPQETSPNDTTTPAQGLDQDNHEEDVEPNDQDQEESNDQGRDEDDGDKGEASPHPRVHQNVQRDHPVNNILGDVKRGVTIWSRVRNFCEQYSFIAYFEPFKIEDALHDPDWVVALQEELNNFKRNEVWYLIEKPKQNVVGSKWVFHNKQDEHEVVTRNKARLIAKGYSQAEGLDFDETFAPVARLELICMLLAYAIHHSFKLYQIDIKSAFLNDPIKKEVYVEQPPDFKSEGYPNHIYKPHKTLYGLKQSPKHGMNALGTSLLKMVL